MLKSRDQFLMVSVSVSKALVSLTSLAFSTLYQSHDVTISSMGHMSAGFSLSCGLSYIYFDVLVLNCDHILLFGVLSQQVYLFLACPSTILHFCSHYASNFIMGFNL